MFRYILDAGIAYDKVKAAIEAGDPRDSLVEHRVLGDGPRYTLEEVAERTGMSVELVVEVGRAAGLRQPQPGVPTISPPEMEAFARFAEVRDFFGEEIVLRFTRVLGTSVVRVAEAAVTMFGVNVEDPLLQRGGTQRELTETADVAISSLPIIPEMFGLLFRRHAVDAIRRLSLARSDECSHDTVTVAIGFADLVGSTEWVQDLGPKELADALGEFERLAHQAVGDGARVVKTIGDEVMFMAVDADDACRAALDLVGLVEAEARLPGLRVGLAYGRVVALDGDFYGSVVNLAARLVHVAESGACVVDPGIAGAMGTGWRADPLAAQLLPGFDAPVTPFTVTRSPT
jgi:adenylate cyclase